MTFFRGDRAAPGRADGTTVLGLESVWTWVALGAFWGINVALALFSGCIGEPAWYGLASAGLGLLLWLGYAAQGDRLPCWATVVIGGLTPLTVLFGILGVLPDDPGMAYYFVMQGASIVLGWMCLRGRIGVALASFACCTAVVIWASALQLIAAEQLWRGYVNAVAVVAIGVAFTLTVGRSARRIHRLRVRTLDEVSARAAQSAIRAERDVQLTRLAAIARPMLDRVASGAELDAADSLRAMLIEGQLRDRMRAPLLDTPELVAAVTAARTRGVKVTLLDDSNPPEYVAAAASDGSRRAPTSDDVRWYRVINDVRAAAVIELADAVAGTEVTVRILPRTRTVIATMLVSTGDQVVQREFAAS